MGTAAERVRSSSTAECLKVTLRMPLTHQHLAMHFEQIHGFHAMGEEVSITGVIFTDELERIIGTGREDFHLDRVAHLRAAISIGGE